jgi:hypothetical protein
MAFKASGLPIKLALPPVQRIKEFLDKLPYREVKTSAELAAKIDSTTKRLRDLRQNNPSLSEYSDNLPSNMGGTQTLWGSRRTIRKLKQEHERIQNEYQGSS